MAKLTTLEPGIHDKLKVREAGVIEVAKLQQVINISVQEIANAAANFPVFLNKSASSGHYDLSALMGIEARKNLFVSDGQWSAAYMPMFLRTYPLYLVPSDMQDDAFNIAIAQDSPAISEQEGEDLFDADSKPTDFLNSKKQLLESELKNGVASAQFVQTIEKMRLLREIDLVIYYADGTKQPLKGLHTINEDRLHNISQEELAELHSSDYLLLIHALLLSLFQLNQLIRRHNESSSDKISQIKLEVADEAHQHI